MSTEHNKTLVTEFLRAMPDGRLDMMADDALLWVAGSSPLAGPKSKQELTAMLASVAAIAAERFVITPISFIADGDHVAVEATTRLRLKNGKVYVNEYHMAFTLKDGKVTRVKEYSDTAHVMATFSAL